jgi:hypothetical protein
VKERRPVPIGANTWRNNLRVSDHLLRVVCYGTIAIVAWLLAAGAMVKANVETDRVTAAYSASETHAPLPPARTVVINRASNQWFATIPLDLHVRGSRAIILNASNRIIAIHSNTPRHDAHLHFLQDTLSGPKLDSSPDLLSQYLTLQPQIDWSKTGLVYHSP